MLSSIWLGCTPAKPGAPIEGPHAETTASRPSSSPPTIDGGVPRACTHDSKDLAPCVEDCDRGLAFACMLVALRVERGEGVPKDLTRAVRLHERACELRDASSCVSAARMHASGSGVPPTRAKQIELLATACTLGDVHACSVPAKAFASGTGVARDEPRAADLWQRACAGGVTPACEAIEPAPPTP
jgi:TPR repeat protein